MLAVCPAVTTSPSSSHLARQSFSLWIKSDGFCGLVWSLQCGVEGCMIPTWASHAAAPVLGPVPHVWECWAVGLRNWVLLNLPVWAQLREKCEWCAGPGSAELPRSLWHESLHTVAHKADPAQSHQWQIIQAKSYTNAATHLLGSEGGSLCGGCADLLEIRFSTCST